MTACIHCYDACLKEEHVNMMVECIRLDRECADICSFLAQAMGREHRLVQSWLKFVPRFVKAAEMNAKNTIMNIVKNVPGMFEMRRRMQQISRLM